MVIHSLYINKTSSGECLKERCLEYVNDSVTNHSLCEQLDVVININNILLFQGFNVKCLITSQEFCK